MSGRSGYRKSHHPSLGRFGVERTQRRGPPTTAPLWRLFFLLPAELSFSITDGPYSGVLGVSIFHGTVTITGRKDWVLDQAAVFLMKVAREMMPLTMIARLSRDDEEAAQFVHPPKRGEDDTLEFIVASGKPVVVMTGRYMRTIVRA